MLFFQQLELLFTRREPVPLTAPSLPAATSPPRRCTRDLALEAEARHLLQRIGVASLIPLVQVEWNARLRSAAGRAHYRRALVSLNPRLHQHGAAEIDRTLRHELAHLVAHSRAGRRRIAPHGREWRQACADLGIADEQRCHTLPFPSQRQERRLLYVCPKCGRTFPRVRRIRRTVACLACCREHASGLFAKEYELRLVRPERSS